MQKIEQFLPLRPLSVALCLIALTLGLLASVAALSGDDFGRVNLLYSLALFAGLPTISLIVTLVLLFLGRRSGIAAWLIELHLAPKRLASILSRHGSAAQRQAALFSLSQSLVLSFAVGNLIGFVLMLLASDVSFVWRSTLLDAAALFPLLDAIAAPWEFWQPAQPTLEMLSLTQDFRLEGSPEGTNYVGQWWQFLLAAQLCYSIAPRLLLWSFAGNKLKRASQIQGNEKDLRQSLYTVNSPFKADKLAESVNSISAKSVVFDCAHTPPALLAELKQRLSASAIHGCSSGLLFQLEGMPEASTRPFVIVVRSWEPPLAELADSILQAFTAEQRSNLFLAPIDWASNPHQGDRLIEPKIAHTQEWRRFCANTVGCTHLAISEEQL